MSFEAIAPAVRGEASAPKWSRFLRVLNRADADRPLAGADGSVHMLLRAFAIASALAFALVAALLSMPDGWGRFRSSEALRAGAQSRLARGRAFVLLDQSRSHRSTARRRCGRGDRRGGEGLVRLRRRGAGGFVRHGRRGPAVLQFGPVRVARAIVEHVVQAASTTGSDPALLMAIADKESSFAPKAKASTSSASGLFQFINSTWLKAVRMFGRQPWPGGGGRGDRGRATIASRRRSAPRSSPCATTLISPPCLAAEMLKHDGEQASPSASAGR